MGPVNLFEVKSYSIEEEFIEYSNFIAVNKIYLIFVKLKKHLPLQEVISLIKYEKLIIAKLTNHL